MNLKNKQTNRVRRLLLLLVGLCLVLVPARLVFAQTEVTDSSDSAQQQDDKENSTIDNIKKVIQEKKTELGTAGAELRTQKAYLAQVLRVSEETLTVSNYTGNQIIPLDEDILIQKNNKDIAIEDIAIDDWLGVYEEMTDGSLKISKIVVYDQDFTPKDKKIILGSITSIGNSDVAITPRSGEEELHLSFSKNTTFEDNRGEEIMQSDLYEDLQCLVIAFADKNGNYVVSTLRALSVFDD